LLEFLFEIAFSHFAEYAPQIFNSAVRLFDHGEGFVLPDVVRRLFIEGRPQITRAIDGVGQARHRNGAWQSGVNVQLLVVILVVFQRPLNFLRDLLTEIEFLKELSFINVVDLVDIIDLLVSGQDF
jgi:hypothetical protein